MDWTIKDPKRANNNPQVVVNGVGGKAPILIEAKAGVALTLDTAGTSDPDGNALLYRWLYYPEAGTGIPGQPVVTGREVPIGGGGSRDVGGIPSAPQGGPREPPARVTLSVDATERMTGPLRERVLPRVPGIAHVVLVVEDNGTPSLTSYRRVIITIRQSRRGGCPLFEIRRVGRRTAHQPGSTRSARR
jgi:hypothetical protein